jgi:hypothetical protein
MLCLLAFCSITLVSGVLNTNPLVPLALLVGNELVSNEKNNSL